MGHIKEPKGVDFVIASDPLTEKARKEISTFINSYILSSKAKKSNPTKKVKLNHSLK